MHSRSSSSRLADLLAQSTHTRDGAFAVDSQHRIVFWNQAAESLLGYHASEVLGKHCYEIIQGRDCHGAPLCGKRCPHFEEAKTLQWGQHQNLQVRSKTGQDRRLQMTTLSLLSPKQELRAVVHLFWSGEYGEPAPPPADTAVSNTSWPAADIELAMLPLTPQERTVLGLLTEGLSTRQIAARLFISPTTVRNHVQNLLKKLRVHNRLEALLLVFQRLL